MLQSLHSVLLTNAVGLCLDSRRVYRLVFNTAVFACRKPSRAVLFHNTYMLLPAATSHSQIDLGFMAELAAVVPVVPVLAKADTMTAEELKVGRSKGFGGCSGAEGCSLLWLRCNNSPDRMLPATAL